MDFNQQKRKRTNFLSGLKEGLLDVLLFIFGGLKPALHKKAKCLCTSPWRYIDCLYYLSDYFFAASARAMYFSISRPSDVVGYFSFIVLYASRADLASF